MLTQEEAQRQLKQAEIKDWVKRRMKALGLMSPVRKPGRLLLERFVEPRSVGLSYGSLDAYEDYYERLKQARKKEEKLAQTLDAMPNKQRQNLFDRLFPKTGAYVSGAWNLLHRLPYARYHCSFRAPTTPSMTSLRRLNWLQTAISSFGCYEQDIEWLAAWAGHIQPSYRHWDSLAILLAAAIDAGGREGEAVLDILTCSAQGEHPVGVMGYHVPVALLTSSRPEAWEYVEKLLLAAQREEGLRQCILEVADWAHPQAFRRMLRLILEHDLLRFSATVRALDVWFGFQWDSANGRALATVLEQALKYLESAEARTSALTEEDPQNAYLSLWASGFEDAPAAVPLTEYLLVSSNPEIRFVAAYFLSNAGLSTAEEKLFPLLEDDDLRIASFVMNSLHTGLGEASPRLRRRMEEPLRRLMNRAPKKPSRPKPIVWPWAVCPLDKKSVCSVLHQCLKMDSPHEMIAHLEFLDPGDRESLARSLGKQKTQKARATLLDLTGDTSSSVRQAAIEGMVKTGRISEKEAHILEGYLKRKASDLRRGVLTLLLTQEDAKSLASADRLVASKTQRQREGGFELLREMIDANRSVQACRKRLSELSEDTEEVSGQSRTHIEAAMEDKPALAWTLENALGLIDPTDLTKPALPEVRDFPYGFKAASACVKSMDALIHEHREDTITVTDYYDYYLAPGDASEGGTRQLILGEGDLRLPSVFFVGKTAEELAEEMPLRDVLEEWHEQRPKNQRDPDGCELVRALILPEEESEWALARRPYEKPLNQVLAGSSRFPGAKYFPQLQSMLRWVAFVHMPKQAPSLALDAMETVLAHVPEDLTQKLCGQWQRANAVERLVDLASSIRKIRPDLWAEVHEARYWGLLHWMHRPWHDGAKGNPAIMRAIRKAMGGTEDSGTWRPELENLLRAFRAGSINDADVLHYLLSGPGGSYDSFRAFARLTSRREQSLLRDTQGVEAIVEKARGRVLEIELKRGEMPTPATEAALGLSSVYGAETVLRVLQALGKGKLTRGYVFDNSGRECVFSHLLQVSLPLQEDTPESFAELANECKIPRKRLIEFGVYAPQWARFVEHATGFGGLEDAVWWIHAHTKDASWRGYRNTHEWWAAECTERTPLTAEELQSGAVDVDWFERVTGAIGEQSWEMVYKAAKYASDSIGHTRARLFADAMLGRCDAGSLTERIFKKRHQDSVRALGLVPLPKTGKAREAEVLQRYETFQEFLRTGKKFGAQRRGNEKAAVGMGMDNLARSAGYADPIRLQWAMERMLVADLATGPVSVTQGETTISLSIDRQGVPQIGVEKKDKKLKSVPAALKKDARVKELTSRKTDLRRQVSRMRLSLETAMCRGDAFPGKELVELFGHPMLAPMLRNLVFVADDMMGYPIEGGRALQSSDGEVLAVGTTDSLRLAHPYDLLQSGRWDQWQHDCFAVERIQPFKQVFRELYVLTDTERAGHSLSRRYAGHQLHPRQAMGLLNKRGWIAHHEEGVRRTFHKEKISAWLDAMFPFYTPAEIEGVTLEGVYFRAASEHRSMPLEDVPPRVFSEVMRDIDLVVSVAHRGNVDPEASASSVEMRSSLLKETLRLLGIDNVRVEERRALVDGKLGSYSVHLGSAVTHKMPGGMLFIVPVGAQHRGRLFLPFADDDPKTAEVLSKVLLLARDDKIKDPNILRQIR